MIARQLTSGNREPAAENPMSRGKTRDLAVHADVLALLPDPETVRSCLDVAEEAASAIGGTLAAAHVGADPEGMIAAPEEIDLQQLRDFDEGSPLDRLERVATAFDTWKRQRPGRDPVVLDDCRGDLALCVSIECHESGMVVAPCFGNLDARDAFRDMLFDEHKLVLVPPCRPLAGKLLGHVVVCWKPGGGAERAVIAARRWLAVADRLTVLCVNDKTDGYYAFTARELFTQIGLEPEIVSIDSGKRNVGAAILDYAQDAGATCLVTGAFRFGPVLELVLGRVTPYLLSHAALPLLMKH